MDDLKTYLGKPSPLQLYSEGMDLFRKYALGVYGHHYSTLILGVFGSNKQILLQCLTDVSKNPPKAIHKPVIELPPAKPVKNRQPTTSLELDCVLSLRRYRQKRKKASQQFHTCAEGNEGNTARAAICDVIDNINLEIKKEEQTLAHVQKYGSLPIDEDKNLFGELPTNLKDAIKQRNQLSSNILKVEKRILFLLDQPENSRKRKKIPDKQAQLSALNARKSELRLIIQKLKNEDAIQTTS